MSKLLTDPAVMTAEDHELLRRARAGYAMDEFPTGAPPFPNPEGGILEGHRVVFTGNLPGKVSRQDAWNKVAELGGEVGVGVTKKTTMLVVGDWLEFTLRPGYDISTKFEKALDYRERGIPIRLLDGIEFVDTLGLKPTIKKPAARRQRRAGSLGDEVEAMITQAMNDVLRQKLAEQGLNDQQIDQAVADITGDLNLPKLDTTNI